jgi:hypothetical protein
VLFSEMPVPFRVEEEVSNIILYIKGDDSKPEVALNLLRMCVEIYISKKLGGPVDFKLMDTKNLTKKIEDHQECMLSMARFQSTLNLVSQ